MFIYTEKSMGKYDLILITNFNFELATNKPASGWNIKFSDADIVKVHVKNSSWIAKSCVNCGTLVCRLS